MWPSQRTRPLKRRQASAARFARTPAGPSRGPAGNAVVLLLALPFAVPAAVALALGLGLLPRLAFGFLCLRRCDREAVVGRDAGAERGALEAVRLARG